MSDVLLAFIWDFLFMYTMCKRCMDTLPISPIFLVVKSQLFSYKTLVRKGTNVLPRGQQLSWHYNYFEWCGGVEVRAFYWASFCTPTFTMSFWTLHTCFAILEQICLLAPGKEPMLQHRKHHRPEVFNLIHEV